MSLKWRRTLLLLTAASLSVTLFMVYYSYEHRASSIQDTAAQFAQLPPLEELNDPQNNGFRRIAHFGAKAEDVNKGNDFWKRAVKPLKKEMLNRKDFGDVKYFGAEEKESYPMKKNSVQSVSNRNASEATGVVSYVSTTVTSNLTDDQKEKYVEEKVDVQRSENRNVRKTKLPVMEEFYPVKGKQPIDDEEKEKFQENNLDNFNGGNVISKIEKIEAQVIEDIHPVKAEKQTDDDKDNLKSVVNKIAESSRGGVALKIEDTEIEDFYPVKAKRPVEATKSVITEPVVEPTVNSSDWKSYFNRIPRIDGENIIAMSLYGSNMRYTMGAIRNAELIRENFPGWKLRIYTESPSENPRYGLVPQTVISKLRDLSAEIHFMLPGEGFIPPMMWRFLVADDLWVDRFIIRDSDARLTDRDAAAVHAWVKSEKPFNCIRDHPSHAGYAISGGMWGARPQLLYSILRRSWKDMMRGVRTEYLQDMNFLNYVVWPKVQHHAYCSDSVSCDQWPGAHPFPVPRLGYEHVGQVVNEHDLGRPIDIQILRTAGENDKCVPKVNIRDVLRNKS
ncbi:hypothetical protein CAPTEDRAFT_228752 [Capitella teleta]|uniref:Uncharacterized protein n=1 Tax=Capitella teleta TaxID=283909 RepID=R7TPR9_CAPTE|nr:hypothetical protein CAPTEDRAFT_228752 [Capitella teleta]|eukprot:ELT95567.1 hypothetical protein CAPTEDRAFT_228752 [Capitella teleta]